MAETSQQKRKKLENYFIHFYKYFIIFGVLGLFFVIVNPKEQLKQIFEHEFSLMFMIYAWPAFIMVAVYILATVASVCLIIFGAYKIKSGTTTDQEVDTIRHNDLDRVHEVALKRIGVKEEEFVEPVLTIVGIPDKYRLYQKKGADSVIRMSALAITEFFFTKDKLIVYSCTTDLLTGYIVRETNTTFEYHKILSIMLQDMEQVFFFRRIFFAQKIKDTKTKTLVLTTAEGTFINLAIESKKLFGKIGKGTFPVNETKEAIRRLRTDIDEIQHRRKKWNRPVRRENPF